MSAHIIRVPAVVAACCLCAGLLHAQFGQTLQYFPQAAVGGGWVTEISVHNPGQTAGVFHLEVIASGGETLREVTLNVAPRATTVVTLGAGEQQLNVGWARLRAISGEFMAAVSFRLTTGQVTLPRVGVLPATPTSSLRCFAFLGQGQNTGIAMANPSEVTTADITFRLVALDGVPTYTGGTSLAPRRHVASFLNEPPWLPGLNNFQGVVEIESTQPLTLLMLRSDPGGFSAAPVIGPSLASLGPGGVTRDFIADGAVTKEKLSAPDGVVGQFLTIDGNGLSWRNFLPYFGVGSSPASTDIFSVNNLGAGRAMTAGAVSDTALLGMSVGGPGLEGRSTSNNGVVGTTDAADTGWAAKSGVYGSGTAGIGVTGKSTQNHGVRGIADAVGKSGVAGESSAGYGVSGSSSQQDGVVGVTNGPGKAGVLGQSKPGVGVRGVSENEDGVEGSTSSAIKAGVWGHSVAGVGAAGRSDDNDGVLGSTSSQNASRAGVHGRNTGPGPAVFAEGGLHVTGSFTGNRGGNQGAPFPRPAWDSGWVNLGPATDDDLHITLYHNLGGNIDDYFVHVDAAMPIAGEKNLTNQEHTTQWSWTCSTDSIYLSHNETFLCRINQFRVRIWLCN